MTNNVPLFHVEGPAYYEAAYAHNISFAEPIGGSFFTSLPDPEENAFRDWVKRNHVPFDVDAAIADYDMRGYWKATGGNWSGKGAHFPDTWKTPYDTTFSDQSRYATSGCPFKWHGEILIDERDGQVIFNEQYSRERRSGNFQTQAVDDNHGLGSKKDRVQGTNSHLVDLVLHNGKKLALEIGGGITPTPTLTRTIEGSSSIMLGIYDPDLSFLQTSLLAEQWDAKIDGLWFRYVSTSKTGKNLSLTLEDRDVAKLRTFKGPKKVLRAKSTRAEFVKSLVEEAAPDLDFVCPQLHVKQPIETKEKAKKAKAESKANLGKGLGDTKGLKINGQAATKAQIELGHTALQIAEHANASFIVQVALVAALIDESEMGAASGNVLQALGSGGAPIGSAEEEISGFLTGKPKWTGTSAIQYHLSLIHI